IDIWVYDLSDTTSIRKLTFNQASTSPVWTPDGQRIVFESGRDGDKGLYLQRADGGGAAERLTTPTNNETQIPFSWTPALKTLRFGRDSPGGLWTVSVDGEHKPARLIEKASSDGASFSPDGRWIAYSTFSTTRSDIYVEPYPLNGSRHAISSAGGIHPVWSRD